MIQLQSREPFFGHPPAGFIYGGPLYYAPYPYSPYPPYHPYFPQGSLGSAPQGKYGERLIPAARVRLLVDPVSAGVFVDGVRLMQRDNLTYEVALLEGPHHVEARAERFAPYSEVVEVPGAQQVILAIQLIRSQQGDARGGNRGY